MKYYSEKTKKFYDTIDACTEAENALELAEKQKKDAELKEKETRKEDAAKVEASYREYVEAQKVADEKYKTYTLEKKKFIEKHHSFHISDNNGDISVTTASDFVDDLFDTFKTIWNF